MIRILIISVCKFECVSELVLFLENFVEKLTNTFKLTHINKQNKKETSHLCGEKLYHMIYLYIFSIYANTKDRCMNRKAHRSLP
jgi:hypothetical protein